MLNQRTLEVLTARRGGDPERTVLDEAAWLLETIAHLEGVERLLLPTADRLRTLKYLLSSLPPKAIEIDKLIEEMR